LRRGNFHALDFSNTVARERCCTDVADGSQAVRLGASKCRPLCPKADMAGRFMSTRPSTNSNVEAGKSLPAGAAHSMRASAQITAPGAMTSMIVAVSTRPNRQNRSTRSRMSVPLVVTSPQGRLACVMNCSTLSSSR